MFSCGMYINFSREQLRPQNSIPVCSVSALLVLSFISKVFYWKYIYCDPILLESGAKSRRQAALRTSWSFSLALSLAAGICDDPKRALNVRIYAQILPSAEQLQQQQPRQLQQQQLARDTRFHREGGGCPI